MWITFHESGKYYVFGSGTKYRMSHKSCFKTQVTIKEDITIHDSANRTTRLFYCKSTVIWEMEKRTCRCVVVVQFCRFHGQRGISIMVKFQTLDCSIQKESWTKSQKQSQSENTLLYLKYSEQLYCELFPSSILMSSINWMICCMKWLKIVLFLKSLLRTIERSQFSAHMQCHGKNIYF